MEINDKDFEKRAAKIPADIRAKLEAMYRMEHNTRTDVGLGLDDCLYHSYCEACTGQSLTSRSSESTGLSLPFRRALREALGFQDAD